MKKDFFNGNIKREFVSYMWVSIVVIGAISFGVGGLLIFFSNTVNAADNATRILLFVLGIFLFLLGVWFVGGTIFIIRTYPKHKKYLKWFLNSDCYFVDSDSKEYHGHRCGKAAFEMVNIIAEQNSDIVDIKYPKQYKIFAILGALGIILSFVILFTTWYVLENIAMLPKVLQEEGVVFAIFMVLEILDLILSFIFAFRVKKIREKTILEFRAKNKKR